MMAPMKTPIFMNLPLREKTKPDHYIKMCKHPYPKFMQVIEIMAIPAGLETATC